MDLFKNRYISALTNRVIPKVIHDSFEISGGMSPFFNDVMKIGNLKFNTFSSQSRYSMLTKLVTSPPFITKELFNEILSDINLYAISLLDTPILNEYIASTTKYTKISQRFLYSNLLANNIINELLSYSCRHIDIISDADQPTISTFNIGNYVTLPFCIENSKCYNGQILLSSSTIDEVQFENFSEISALPLESPILVRYVATSGLNRNIIPIQCAINTFDTNVIYINTYGDVESITVEATYNNETVYSSTIESNEALFTFPTVTINGLRVILSLSNFNLNKQMSFEISELMILGNVMFASSADFETKQVQINNFSDINKIQVNAINYSDNTSVGFDKFISLSLNESVKNYFQIDNVSGAFIPSSKYTYTKEYLLDEFALPLAISCIAAGTLGPIQSNFFKYVLPVTPDSHLNYKDAKILVGTNDAFGTNRDVSADNGHIFENWTKIDNYYRTMILNNEDKVLIDIGLNHIKLNNIDVSGVITIPQGISMIDVHESIFDSSLGSTEIDPYTVNCIANDNYIYGDKLFPYNFAYKLAGMPQYEHGNLNIVDDENIEIIDTTVIQLDTPFLPLTLSVTSELTTDHYSLHLGNIPVQPGTFSVEPNRGIVRIHSFQNALAKFEDTVTITYTAASLDIRPCGILFNRLATYIDYKSIYNMLAILSTADSQYFTYYIVDEEEALLIPKVIQSIEYMKPYHNKIIYNMYESRLFAAAKFTLRTNNSYVSPAIKNIFIQGYK